MKNLLLVLLLITTLPVTAGDKVYKTVNPDGSVEYSDQPADGSEAIDVPRVPAVKFEKAPRLDPTQTRSNRSDQKSAGYEVRIISPASEASIRDNAGNVTLQGQVTPDLRGTHRLRWQVDGETLEQSGLGVSLSNVDRGAHTARLQVVDGNGRVLATSESLTFYLLRHSANPPANPAPNFNPPKKPASPSAPAS